MRIQNDFIKTLKLNEIDEKNKIEACRSKTIVSLILCLAATMMLIMNLRNNSMIMAYASIGLVIGFILSSVAAGVLKNTFLSGTIIALLVGFVLTVFALTGGNEGFAILWILLVPMFAISLLGIIPGLVVSTYFLVFLFIIFTTPIRESMMDKYNISFISRFPLLYLCDYAISTFFSLQRVYYHKKLENQAYRDGMTGLYNRRYFMEKLQHMSKSSSYSIIMVDLNGLKVVNDKLGHEAGDEFICKTSELFLSEFGHKDKVCRIGGDEIAIISFDTVSVLQDKIDHIKSKASKINRQYDYTISFAVGIATKTENDDTVPEKLIKQADEKMYKSKMEYYQDSTHNRRKR